MTTPEFNAEEIARAQSQFMAVQCARLILLAVSTADALRAAIYACSVLAAMAAPPGMTMAPLVAAIKAACVKAMESLRSLPENSLDVTDDAAWVEDYIDALAQFGVGAPGSLAMVMEMMLHALAGHPAGSEDPLDVRLGNVSIEDRKLAAHVLSAYRKVMKFHLKGS